MAKKDIFAQYHVECKFGTVAIQKDIYQDSFVHVWGKLIGFTATFSTISCSQT